MVIEVDASERVHDNAAGDTFLKVGDENRKLGIFEAQELRYDKGDSTFDGRSSLAPAAMTWSRVWQTGISRRSTHRTGPRPRFARGVSWPGRRVDRR